MTDHAKSNVVGAIVGTVTALLLYGVYTLIPEQPSLPLMIVIDGAPHLRGAHQQKPNGVKWPPPLGGPQTVAGADVPREDSKYGRQVMPHARGDGFLGSERPRSTSVAQRDSTSRAWLTCIEAIFENVQRTWEIKARTTDVLALEISSCAPSALHRFASKEGVTDERSRTDAGHGDTPRTELASPGSDRYAGDDNRATGDAADRIGELEGEQAGAEGFDRSSGVALQAAAVTETPWTATTNHTSSNMATSATRSLVRSAEPARVGAAISASSNMTWDCRPSADTDFAPSAAAWIAKANTWADSIDAKYDRSISIYYDRLRCNGSIPFGWYVSTHNTLTGAAFSDETPVEWMCSQHMDSPLASMMVRTLPVRPTFGGPYDSVLISYNDHDRRIEIGEGTEYAGCGVTAGKPCQFRAAFPCVWPMFAIYKDDKGKPVAVVSGWDVKVPGRIEVGPKEAQP
jgi:hypothetical protein